MLHKSSSEYSSNCEEAMFRVQKASLNMFWEYSPHIASDWLWAESSPVDEEKIKMDDNVNTSFASEGTDLFVNLWEVQPCIWDQEWYRS